ncbi:MMPL family transporter [Nocardioides marmoriginsengisoli]|uniref:MMPL family transporter n=1 Tax=Nocardioides marmoriginsengisoli TaxID=661483 RepID=A0A3N0CNQ7_9ACTN|nr:MMPL family transporter [Nocardioides marmoriginsengisoli]RNL65088.1 MMPL family transporter [Nocardioides marmoriginsengisoli]
MSLSHTLSAVPLRAARWSATHPWRAISAWLAFVLVAVGMAIAIPTQETTDADYAVGDSGKASALVRDAGLDGLPTEDVLITARDGAIDRGAATAAAASLAQQMRALPKVKSVADPAWSPSGKALLVDIELVRGTDDVDALQKITDATAKANPDLSIRQAGDVSIDDGIGDRVADDLASAEGISLPITLILMLLAFGALIAAGIPVLIAASSVAATIGITAPLSHLVHAEPTVSSMIVLIGMAVGVDYSLFYLKREREERAAGHSTVDAVEIAAQTSGHSIIVSGLAVIAAMTGLYVVGGATFNSLATGSILVVAIAVLGSITVLPALLAKLGRWVDRPRVPLLWRLNKRMGRGSISRRILGPVVRRPLVALLVGGAAVVAVAVPSFGMKVHEGNLKTLPADIPQVQTLRTMTAEFPSQGAKAEVVVKADAADRAAVASALEGLKDDAVRSGAFVDEVTDPLQVSRDGTVSVLHLVMPYDESDSRADKAIETLRDLTPKSLKEIDAAGAESYVGGGVAESYDSADHLRTYLPIVVGFVLLLTLLMMGLAFRSGVIAVLSAVLNLVSVGVAFGLLTLVFQHGWFEGLLDFDSPGFVIDWLPMFILVVLVGLSMDYQVFVLSRIREHVRAGLPARLAVERGVTDTAGVVTSAAAVMVSVFAIFATLSMLEMKMMGVGLAVAILIDATLIRLVLMPAALVLIGERAWGRRRPVIGEQVTESDPAYQLV